MIQSTKSQGMDEPRILAILPVLGQPRMAKRLDNLQKEGFNVSALAFSRRYHSGRIPKCPLTEIGSLVDGHYGKRIFSLMRALPRVRQVLSSADVIYAFSPDMALVAILARGLRRIPIVLEVADITKIQTASGVRGWLFRMVDWGITSRCQLLIVTAPRFKTEYYDRWLKVQVPCMVIENKVDASLTEKIRRELKHERSQKIESRRICIGYFGTLRSVWELQVLSALVSRYGDRFEVVIAGFPRQWLDFDNYLAKTPGIRYLGTYKSPVDLPRLYGGVDVTWLCLESVKGNDWNARWLRANRFYESCAFKTPIIAREGAGDAEDIFRFQIGLLISTTRPDITADFIAANIDRSDIERWRNNMEAVPDSVFSYTCEFLKLSAKIRAMNKPKESAVDSV